MRSREALLSGERLPDENPPRYGLQPAPGGPNIMSGILEVLLDIRDLLAKIEDRLP